MQVEESTLASLIIVGKTLIVKDNKNVSRRYYGTRAQVRLSAIAA